MSRQTACLSLYMEKTGVMKGEIMNFSDVMREESKWTKTENGADAKNTTDSALLDMFATIGSVRSR